ASAAENGFFDVTTRAPRRHRRAAGPGLPLNRGAAKAIMPAPPPLAVAVKLVVLALLLAIVFSLGSALVFLSREPEGSTLILPALKFRVALCVALIVLLVVGNQVGWIHA